MRYIATNDPEWVTNNRTRWEEEEVGLEVDGMELDLNPLRIPIDDIGEILDLAAEPDGDTLSRSDSRSSLLPHPSVSSSEINAKEMQLLVQQKLREATTAAQTSSGAGSVLLTCAMMAGLLLLVFGKTCAGLAFAKSSQARPLLADHEADLMAM